MGGIQPPVANAFVDDPNIVENAGNSLDIKATISHNKIDGSEPKAGQTFQYDGVVTFSNFDGTPQQGKISVFQDPNAPFAPLDAGSIKFSIDGVQVEGPQKSDSNPNEFVYTYTNLVAPKGAKVTAKFHTDATVADFVGEGQLVAGSISATAAATASIGLEPVERPYANFDAKAGFCAGQSVMRYRVPKNHAGAWLMDIKFADISANKDAIFTPLPNTPAELINGRDNSVKITDEKGIDITSDYLGASGQSQINQNDTAAPFYGTDAVLAAKNPSFKDSVNWPYNPQTFTGKKWLAPGYVVEVRRGFRMRNCIPVAISTSIDPYRDIIGVQVDVAATQMTTQNNASDAFWTPGERKVAPWCSAMVYTNATKGQTTGDVKIKQFNPRGLDEPVNPTLAIIKNRSFGEVFNGGSAISAKYENWVYYIERRKLPFNLQYNLRRVSTLTNESEDVVLDKPIPSLVGDPQAFDPEGYFWFASGYGTDRASGVQPTMYVAKLNEDGSQGNLVDVGSIPTKPGESFNDLVFDTSGNLYLVTADSNGGMRLYSYNRKSLLSNGFSGTPGRLIAHYSVPEGSNVSYYGEVLGAAWGSDGNLYITRGELDKGKPINSSRASSVVWQLPMPNPSSPDEVIRPVRITQVPSSANVEKKLHMSSCSFGSFTNDAPGMSVNKRPINPSDGSLGPIGGTALNPVIVGDADTVTASYVIEVKNNSDQAATPMAANLNRRPNSPDPVNIPGINDTLAVPVISRDSDAPFTIAGVKVSDYVSGEQMRYEEIHSRSSQIAGSTLATFHIYTGEIPAKGARLVRVDVTYNVNHTNLTAHGYIGECERIGYRNRRDGFVNQVIMEDDSDGGKNNEVCVPFSNPPKSKLILKKEIHNERGENVTSRHQSDLENFILGASPKEGQKIADLQSGVSGKSSNNIYGDLGVAVNQDVLSGTYDLTENISDSGRQQGYFQQQDYTCSITNPDVRGTRTVTGRSVELNPKDTATCVVVNTLRPKIHISKFAGHPETTGLTVDGKPAAARGEHFGEPVELKKDSQGNFVGELTYRIRLTNDSNFVGSVDNVTEIFGMPAGLIVNGDAKVEAWEPRGYDYSRFIEGMRSTIPASELNGPVVLANKVRAIFPPDVYGGGNLGFIVTIPVRSDESIVPGSNTTVWQQHASKLGTCVSDQVGGKNVVSLQSDVHGALNATSMDSENTLYTPGSDLWYRDNFACIPVFKQTNVDIVLHKVDESGKLALPGAEFKVFDRNPGANRGDGTTVPLLDKSNCEAYITGSAGRMACESGFFAQPQPGKQLPSRTDGTAFVISDLKPGKHYWLAETKAPECSTEQKETEYCASLLPDVIEFSVDAQRNITVFGSNDKPIQGTPLKADQRDSQMEKLFGKSNVAPVMYQKSFEIYKGAISVHDPRRAYLPISGGQGPWPLAIGAALLILLSIGYATKTSAVAAKPRKG